MRVFSFTIHAFVRFKERIKGAWQDPSLSRLAWETLYDAARTAVLLDERPEGEGRFFRCADPAMLWIAKREEGVWVVITVLEPDATAGKIDDAVKDWLAEQEDVRKAQAIARERGLHITPPMEPRPIEAHPSGVRPRDLGAWISLEINRASVEKERLRVVMMALSKVERSRVTEIDRRQLDMDNMAKARAEKTERHRLNMVRDWLLVRAWQRLSKTSDDDANEFLLEVAQHMKVSPEDLVDMWTNEATKMGSEAAA